MCQRRFAETRRAEQQGMIKRFPTFFCSSDENFQLLTSFVLADVFVQEFWTQGTFDRFFIGRRGFCVDKSFFAEIVGLDAHVESVVCRCLTSGQGFQGHFNTVWHIAVVRQLFHGEQRFFFRITQCQQGVLYIRARIVR